MAGNFLKYHFTHKHK